MLETPLQGRGAVHDLLHVIFTNKKSPTHLLQMSLSTPTTLSGRRLTNCSKLDQSNYINIDQNSSPSMQIYLWSFGASSTSVSLRS